MTPPDTSARVALRMRAWLLEGPAQMRDGFHAGGVGGGLDANGHPGYLYGETTGYYLHWLAGLGVDAAGRAGRAAAAVAWSERQFLDALPLTRVPLGPAMSDWRNDAVFFFDLAMLAGGIAAAVQAGLVALPVRLLARLGDELGRFVVDGELTPVRALPGSAPLPDRWSTRLDRFELKAATRVLLAARVAPMPAALRAACLKLIAQRAPEVAGAPVELLHPTLYYLEGVLAGTRLHWSGAAQLLGRVLALVNERGELPESPHAPGVWRSDVIAQALRVGLLLRAHAVEGAPAAATLDTLAGTLAARVRDDGSIAFRTDVATPLANVWCAMFAEQALRWHAEVGAAPPQAELIV